MKRNAYFTWMFVLFWLALLYCCICRTLLKLDYTDPETGFYIVSNWMTLSQDLVMGAGMFGLVMLNVFKPVENDFPIFRSGRGVGLLAVLSGIALAFFVAESMELFVPGPNAGIALGGFTGMFASMLGIGAAVSMIVIGGRLMMAPDSEHGGALLLFLCFWQLVTLVVKFNRYETLVTIQDNLLTMLFMVFACMFMVGHARTLAGFSRKDGRNYTISTGLGTALCGLVLTVPGYAELFFERTLTLSAPELGSMESLFIFVFSLYALAFVRRLCSCIQTV